MLRETVSDREEGPDDLTWCLQKALKTRFQGVGTGSSSYLHSLEPKEFSFIVIEDAGSNQRFIIDVCI